MTSSRPQTFELRPEESLDEFMEGRLRVIQSRNGYRFSIDAVLLAEFVSIKAGDILIDLGTGCGIIPLMLLQRKPLGHAFGVEIQPPLADQAARNVLLNGFGQKMDIILGDVRHPPFKPLSADVVVCNPPFRSQKSGRINPDPQRAIARHEILVSLDDILAIARKVLRPKGRIAMIYPAVRLVDMMARMRGYNLEPKRLRVIYPGLSSEAKLVLIEASKGGGSGLKVMPPLIDQGEFSVS